MSQTQLLTPPLPAGAPGAMPWYRAIALFRRNALQVWAPEAYEQPIETRRLLGRTRLLINSPGAIRHVLIDNTANYRRSPATYRILGPIVGRGLFLSEGEDWKHQRRTLAPAFAPRTLPLLARHVAAATDEAVLRLQREAGRPTHLFAAIQHLALEIAGRSMFSLEMRDRGPELRALLVRYGERLGRPYLLDMLLPRGVPSPHDLARWWFRPQWRRLMERLIGERRQAPAADAPRDLLDLLAAARDPESGAAFSASQLRDQVATMLVAGHETTAVALFWSLYLLALAPAEQDKVAAEVAGLDLGPEGAAEALPHLVHSRAVVSEGVRLYPPAFTMVRVAIGTDELDGVAVAPGSLIMISPWVLHRHRRLWRDPEAFDPSRFLPGAPAIDRFAYLPFGVGPRVCIGAQFALTEATLVLARLVQAFRITVERTPPVLPVGVITTQPDHSPLFTLNPRR